MGAAAAAPEMTWLRLTNGTGSVGAAWYNSPLHLANGFEARFTLCGSIRARRTAV